MASLPSTLQTKTRQGEEGEVDEHSYRRHRELASTLPANDRWLPLRKFQGFWFLSSWIPGTLAAREHFVALPTDILLASFPKSGTTWLKSMVFSVAYRGQYPPRDEGHPLRSANPHDLVPRLDGFYLRQKNPDFVELPSPRIFSTHSPYSVLPESIKNSGSRVIYVTREPKDTFVSSWHFSRGVTAPEGMSVVSMEDFFDMFCSGIFPCGPIWEHALEYWDEHRRHPDRVLLLKYEAMKEDPVGTLKKLAVFMGCPFTEEEEEGGMPRSISELCSFKSLSNLEVNKEGVLEQRVLVIEKKMLFRKGEVGDWVNHLTPEMAEKMDKITQEKIQSSGFIF